MKDIKLIVTDLDGTLLRSDKTISAYDAATALYRRLSKDSCCFSFSAQSFDSRWMNKIRASFTTAINKSMGVLPLVFDDDAFPKADFTNLSVRRFDLTRLFEILGEFPQQHGYITSGEDLVDIPLNTATKWNAIKMVAASFGIPTTNIATFGDDYNDIEMLQKL
jgi:hydroxymethylpyrimidine pyrophosphatase-like HAD family hydrolase